MYSYSRHATITIGIMAFMGILIMYVETMVLPAVPVLENVFNTNYDYLSWIITAYVISGTISAAIFGRLADIFGKKRIFVILALIYAVAVAFGGFAQTLYEFVLVRAVQGLGMGMFPVAFALLNDQVPREELPLAQGIVSSTFMGGAALGLVLGAWITQNYGWQWSYHSAIPVAVCLTALSVIFLKDNSVHKVEKVDYLGISLLASGVLMLILGLSEGEFWGWHSSAILTVFAVSVALIVLFVLVELRVQQPFISMKLLAIRNVFLSNFTGLFALSGMFFLFYSVPALLQDPVPLGFGLTITKSGLIMLPTALASMALAPLSAKITRSLGPKVAIVIGTVVLFIAFAALYFNRGTTLEVLEDVTIMGAGMSFIFVGTINILIVSSPRSETGASTGMNVVFRNIGTAIAAAVSGVIETIHSVSIPLDGKVYSFPTSHAFNDIYLVGMVFLALSIVFTLMMRNVVFVRKTTGTDSSRGIDQPELENV